MKRTAGVFIINICIFLLCSSGSFAATRSGEPAATQLTELAQNLSKITGIYSSFKQTRYLSFLDETLISEGFFEFHKPAELLWQYNTPAYFRMEYKNGIASFSSAPESSSAPSTKKTASSRQEAELAARVSRNIMTWITLDLQNLQLNYNVSVINTDPLLLRFKSKNAGDSATLQNISLKFAKNNLDVLEVFIEETDGDYIRLEFSNSRHSE